MERTPKRAVAISVNPTGMNPAESTPASVHLRARTAENNPLLSPAAAPESSKSPAASPSLRSAKAAARPKRRDGGTTDGNADNLAALYQAKDDLEEALGVCEDRLASMEEELLQRSPYVSTPRRVWAYLAGMVWRSCVTACGNADMFHGVVYRDTWCRRSLKCSSVITTAVRVPLTLLADLEGGRERNRRRRTGWGGHTGDAQDGGVCKLMMIDEFAIIFYPIRVRIISKFEI